MPAGGVAAVKKGDYCIEALERFEPWVGVGIGKAQSEVEAVLRDGRWRLRLNAALHLGVGLDRFEQGEPEGGIGQG